MFATTLVIEREPLTWAGLPAAVQSWLLAAGGFALAGLLIWLLARLSMKEAVRSKILWAFSFLVLVFLFGSWFIPAKPEAQVQTYVETVFVVMNVLLLITAGLLASLSIPTDVRRQTIHTIVTKP